MKIFFLILFHFLFSISTFAQEVPVLFPETVLTYKNNYEIEFLRYEEYVDTKVEEGPQIVKDLQKNGYSCFWMSEAITYCNKDITDGSILEPQVKETIEYQYSEFQIHIYEAFGKPELIYNSEDVKFWQVDQKAIIDGVYLAKVSYGINAGTDMVTMGPNEAGVNFSFYRQSNSNGEVLKLTRYMHLKATNGQLLKASVLIHFEK